MSEPDAVLVERDGPVTIVSINRPHCRNAVDGATARKLYDAFLAFDADTDASVAVFTGTGGYFCAGADLKAVARGDREKKREVGGHNTIAPMGPSRLRLSKPVIAAVEGFAVAGGMELALWADMRVVAEDATFGIFCRRFGVPLIDLGTIRLPRLIGHSQAIDLILTGRPVGGPEALRMGLANRLVPKGETRAQAIALAKDIATIPADLPARRPAVGAAAMGSLGGGGDRQRNARRAGGDRLGRNAVRRRALCLRRRPPWRVRATSSDMGNWLIGDDCIPTTSTTGTRTFTTRDFRLQSGVVMPRGDHRLPDAGHAFAERDNVVLITHGNTSGPQMIDPGGSTGEGSLERSWSAPARPVDTNRYFAICPNMLGSSYGSTNAASIDPATGKRYGPRFPDITVSDIVAHPALAARRSRHRQAGRDRRPVLWRIPGLSMGGRLSRRDERDCAGRHRAQRAARAIARAMSRDLRATLSQEPELERRRLLRRPAACWRA